LSEINRIAGPGRGPHGVPAAIAEMNAHAVSLIAEGDAAWLSQDVRTILGRSARSFEQFATDHATAFA